MDMVEMKSFICGDCMDYLPQFPDKYFDIAVVDPPYGIGEHGGKRRSKYVLQKNGSKIFVSDGQYENRDWDNEPPDSRYFDELIRVSKHQIIWGVNYFDYPLAGGRIIWDKCNDGSDQSGAEIAYCSMNNRVDIFRYMWRGMMQGKSIDEGTVQQGNKKLNEKRIHPTQKPVNLYRWIAQKYIEKDWKVLDTHVGSASSLIAYEEYGIDYVGFEKDRYYYDLANKRMQENRAQLTVFDFGVERAFG
jgi:site-specific DNA-methyltransferase (adenine-specific)